VHNAVTGQGWVWAGYHRFFLTPAFVPPATIGQPGNGLVRGEGDSAVITTGIHTGGVRVTAQACAHEPEPDQGPWEDVGETSVLVGPDGLHVTPGEAVETDLTMNLTPFAAGPHRVRVHAQGRMLQYDGSESRSGEAYLIQVWPAPMADDVRVKLSPAYAQQTGMTGAPAEQHPATGPRPPGPPIQPPPPARLHLGPATQ
jgi:hypothetical protein